MSRVPSLGLMGMSQSYGTAEERDERESIATIHRAIELPISSVNGYVAGDLQWACVHRIEAHVARVTLEALPNADR